MMRVADKKGGGSVQLELWNVPDRGLVVILQKEPPGLSIGNVTLQDGRQVLGVRPRTTPLSSPVIPPGHEVSAAHSVGFPCKRHAVLCSRGIHLKSHSVFEEGSQSARTNLEA